MHHVIPALRCRCGCPHFGLGVSSIQVNFCPGPQFSIPQAGTIRASLIRMPPPIAVAQLAPLDSRKFLLLLKNSPSLYSFIDFFIFLNCLVILPGPQNRYAVNVESRPLHGEASKNGELATGMSLTRTFNRPSID